MKIFVTGVAGQLGHDVMNELEKRGYEGVGSDIAENYSGADDGMAVTSMPYVQLDITNEVEVRKVLSEVRARNMLWKTAMLRCLDLMFNKNKKTVGNDCFYDYGL